MLGLTYHGPFDDLPAQKTPGGVFPYGETGGGKTAAEAHRVIAWKEISEAEGTGLVHIAPGCGAEDQQLGKENDLPFIAPLDESSVFLDGFGQFTGRNANEVADDVIAALKATRLAGGARKISARLSALLALQGRAGLPPGGRMVHPHGLARPHSARGADDPVDSARRRSARAGLAAQHERLDDLEEALLGTRAAHLGVRRVRALHGDRQPRGAEGESGRRLGSVRGQFAAPSVYRCGEDSRAKSAAPWRQRIEDVGNPWLDAGIVPFSTMRYTTDRAYWEKWFPADLVLESFPGQFRNWFYSMLAMSAMIDGRAPFKALLGHALVRDARGEEMHKSKGNSIAFDEAAEALGRGSDALHLHRAEDRAESQFSRSSSHRQRRPNDRWRRPAQTVDVLELLQLLRDVCGRRRLEARRCRCSRHQRT